MFIIGQADENEIKRMIELGFEVDNVDIKHFNRAMDPFADCFNEDSENSDKLVSVFIDCDILQQCELIMGK